MYQTAYLLQLRSVLWQQQQHLAHTHHADCSVFLQLLLLAMGLLCVSKCMSASKKCGEMYPRIHPKLGLLPQCTARPCLLARLMRLLLWPSCPGASALPKVAHCIASFSTLPLMASEGLRRAELRVSTQARLPAELSGP